jgi:hypothetical protein
MTAALPQPAFHIHAVSTVLDAVSDDGTVDER